MRTRLATAAPGDHLKPLILAIFAVTYLGIAMGRVRGLKLNRRGASASLAALAGLTAWAVSRN